MLAIYIVLMTSHGLLLEVADYGSEFLQFDSTSQLSYKIAKWENRLSSLYLDKKGGKPNPKIFIIMSGKSYQILLSIFYDIKIVTIERRIQMLESLFSVEIWNDKYPMFHRYSSWIWYSNRMHAKLLKRNKINPITAHIFLLIFMSLGKILMKLQVLLIWAFSVL